MSQPVQMETVDCFTPKIGSRRAETGIQPVKVEVQEATIWISASRLSRNQTHRHGTQLPRNNWFQNCWEWTKFAGSSFGGETAIHRTEACAASCSQLLPPALATTPGSLAAPSPVAGGRLHESISKLLQDPVPMVSADFQETYCKHNPYCNILQPAVPGCLNCGRFFGLMTCFDATEAIALMKAEIPSLVTTLIQVATQVLGSLSLQVWFSLTHHPRKMVENIVHGEFGHLLVATKPTKSYHFSTDSGPNCACLCCTVRRSSWFSRAPWISRENPPRSHWKRLNWSVFVATHPQPTPWALGSIHHHIESIVWLRRYVKHCQATTIVKRKALMAAFLPKTKFSSSYRRYLNRVWLNWAIMQHIATLEELAAVFLSSHIADIPNSLRK